MQTHCCNRETATEPIYVAALGLAVLLLSAATAANATPESSLGRCQQTIGKQVGKLSQSYHKEISRCLDKISREILAAGGTEAPRAVRTCTKSFSKIVNDDQPDRTLAAKTRALVAKACDPRVNRDLEHTEADVIGRGTPRAAQPIRASALDEYCSAFGGDGAVDSVEEWQRCLERAAAWHAYHQVIVEYPRASEWLLQLRADLFDQGGGLGGPIDAIDGVVTDVDPDKDSFIDKIGLHACGVDVVLAEGPDSGGMNRVCISTCYVLICTDVVRPGIFGGPIRWSVDVALGDLDGDGSKDAVFANHGTANTIYAGPFDLISLSAGGFAGFGDIDPAEVFTSAVALGDIDHDDDLDIIFAELDHKGPSGEVTTTGAANQVCVNDGAFSFTCSDISTYTDFSYDVALDDVNGDGHLDAVFANGNCCALPSEKFHNRVCLGDGAGSFDCDHLIDFPREDSSLGVALADLDKDGDIDAVFSQALGVANRTCLNDGTAVFTCSDVSVVFADTGQGSAVALGDLDGDGNAEAVFSYNALGASIGAENRVCVGDGTGGFSVCASINSDTNSSSDVALGDADGDGDLDLFFTNTKDTSSNEQPNRVCLNGGGFIFNCYNLGTDLRSTYGLALGHLYP